MSHTTSRTLHKPPAPATPQQELGSLVLLVVGVTGLGCTAAAVGLGLEPQAIPETTTSYPAWWPPLPLFWMVWLVIYPASAVAAWLVWRSRHAHDVCGALVAFALMNVASALFLPVSSLVGELPSVLTLMDLNGIFAVYGIAWLFSRYARLAAVWMLPYLLWMPTTTILKALLWRYNAA